MSFIYSQALVEASLLGNYSGTDASVQLSGSPTPKPCLWHDKTKDVSRLSRYGMTSRLLTESRGAELLTSWLGASRAKTSASQGKGQALTDNARACGATWRGSLARFDPDTSSWRTAQPSLLEDSDECSVIWPRSGMTADGQCWELPTLGRRISGTGFGFLLPTPCSSDPQLERRAKHGTHYTTTTGTVRRMNEDGTSSNLGLAATLQRWPTPTVCGNYNRKGASATSGDGLATAVYQTPVARMWKDNGKNPSELERNSPTLAMQVGGSLNPTWVEWLMGWPLGWTALKPSETAKSLNVQQQHSECLPQSLEAEA